MSIQGLIFDFGGVINNMRWDVASELEERHGLDPQLADDGDALGVFVMTAVGKIQAKDVDAAFEQGLDHRRLGT